ncbi:Serine/threonine protein kinase [Enhygromyxa salina]|uniref:non-specific serine/threonine protein kinase n=1 Tax=Enhygromyxa salina TaxID=215803 RepID=A0A0C1ZFQ3_9BACT|nr:serine/threonine-protein kinase [Enhygromyxa salina]KIG16494.1 Serine/threonine protein kinase [Enhygromyxa salina]
MSLLPSVSQSTKVSASEREALARAENNTADVETKVVSSVGAGASVSGSGNLADRVVESIDRLGRYVLLDRLGRGAFGTVWTAFDPQLDRRVAIKVVYGRERAGAKLDATRDELLSEAQLLAQLSHPNVVAIHDVGRLADALTPASAAVGGSESGVARRAAVGVFIVMEHLAGPTLAEWLGERERPELGEVLRVFTEAGRGLAAAHARDLVHLDFKPGNVMFGADGRVRVLDFGLARVGRKLRGGGASAGRSRVAGTPAYMAPEQHAGEPADSRADQYAFCVSLWEAVYGQRPFMGDDVDRLLAAKLEGVPKIAPASIRAPHVHAALERGLCIDPNHRFESMEQLLAVLGEDPRLRRRRWIAGVALVAGLLGAGFGLARASDETLADPCALPPDEFVNVWDPQRRAEVEAAFEATGVAFAAEAFEQVAGGLDEQLQTWSTVREEVCRATMVEAKVSVEVMSEQLMCLDRRLRSIAALSETLLAADPEIVARARDSVLALEDPRACRVDTQRDHIGRGDLLEDDRRIALLSVEDALVRARVRGEFGRYEAALEAADQAIERATRLDDPKGLARAHRERGYLLRELGRLDEARDASMAALTSAAQLDERDLESTILIDLVMTHTARGDFSRALGISELLHARIDPARTPELAARVHINAAVMQERQQHWDDALAELDAASALVEALPGSPTALRGQLHLNYGNILTSSGRDFVRGAAEYSEAIELWTEAYGPHHPLIAKTRMNLSAAEYRRGDYIGAIELLEAALADLERLYGSDHPHVSMCHQNLGAMRSIAGEFHEAVRHTRQSLELTAAKIGSEHLNYATTERNLATLLMLLGRHRDAREHFAHAATIYERSYDAQDSRRMAVQAELAEVSWWLGEYELARNYAAQAELALAQTEAAEVRRIGPLSTLAMLELHEGDLASAHAHAHELVEFSASVLGPDSADVARARTQLAEILRELDRRDEAREQLAQALTALTRPDGSVHPFAWAVRLELGRLALADGQPDLAIEQLETALALTQGPEGAEVFAAIVELELAAALPSPARARAQQLREHGLAALASYGVRPDLQGR